MCEKIWKNCRNSLVWNLCVFLINVPKLVVREGGWRATTEGGAAVDNVGKIMLFVHKSM